jgi:hypothetical protein
VAVYFGQQAAFTSRTPTRAIPTQTVTPVPIPSPPPKKSNTAAIAGGAVGGVAALALVIGIIFFFLRKNKRNQSAQIIPMPAPVQPDVSSPQSPAPQYTSDAKYAVSRTGSATPMASPGLTSHSPAQSYSHSYSQSLPHTTPPPMQPIQPNHPTYHPAHAPAVPMEYYPPPDGSRPNLAHLSSSEMPTVRSPPSSSGIVQPWPARSNRAEE